MCTSNFMDWRINSKMNILITGGIGYIGSEMIRRFANSVNIQSVNILDNCSSQRYASLFCVESIKPYRFIDGDILNTEDLERALEGIDTIVHLAGITNAQKTFDNSEEVHKVNYLGTKNLIDVCNKLGVLRFIFASSTSVYGPINGVVQEDRPESELAPQSPYATSKLAAEKDILDATKEGRIDGVCLRFGSVFGPSVGMRFHTFVNQAIWSIVTGKPITIMAAFMDLTRPFLALEDAINSVEFILNRPELKGEIYNVVTLNEKLGLIIDEIKENAPNIKIRYTDEEMLNQISYHVDNTKLKEIGFCYEGNLGNSIRKTLEMLGAFISNN